MGGRDEVYDTQELLSLNMDRLKKFMKKWEGGSDENPDLAEAKKKETKRKRATRLIATGRLRRQILMVLPDPLQLSRMITINDQRSHTMKLNIVWADAFASAIDKMNDEVFRAVVVFEGVEPLPGSDFGITGLDFLLLIHSLMAKDDEDFLLKKRAFVERFVPGQTGLEKVTNFRLLKEDYRNTPFLFVHRPGATRDSTLAARIHGVRTAPMSDSDVSGLMTAIDKTVS